jgi:hypothetical protein
MHHELSSQLESDSDEEDGLGELEIWDNAIGLIAF